MSERDGVEIRVKRSFHSSANAIKSRNNVLSSLMGTYFISTYFPFPTFKAGLALIR